MEEWSDLNQLFIPFVNNKYSILSNIEIDFYRCLSSKVFNVLTVKVGKWRIIIIFVLNQCIQFVLSWRKNQWIHPRSNSPARKRPVLGDPSDFFGSSIPIGNFRIFSDDFRPVPAGKHRKLTGICRKKSGRFLIGILLPYSSDFQCFPAGSSDFPASFLQNPEGSGDRNVRPGISFSFLIIHFFLPSSITNSSGTPVQPKTW